MRAHPDRTLLRKTKAPAAFSPRAQFRLMKII